MGGLDGSDKWQSTEHLPHHVWPLFAFHCLLKLCDQRQLGRETVYFTSQLTVCQEGKSGQELKSGA